MYKILSHLKEACVEKKLGHGVLATSLLPGAGPIVAIPCLSFGDHISLDKNLRMSWRKLEAVHFMF